MSILLLYTLDNADSSVVQFFTLSIRRKEKIFGGLTAKRKEKQLAKLNHTFPNHQSTCQLYT